MALKNISSKQIRILLSVVAFLVLFSCKDEGGAHKPNISGSMGEMLIVMNDSVKESAGGKTLLSVMRQPMVGLPQAESLFDVSVVPHRAFSERLKPFRNLVIVFLGNDREPDVRYYKNRWGKQHAMAEVYAQDTWQLDSLVREEEIKLTGFFVRAERDRSQAYYRKYINKNLTEKFKEVWDASMIIPVNFSENKPGKNFMWMSNETPLTSQGLFVYSFEYTGYESITEPYLLNKRDSVLRANVPGPSEGSYMTTEGRLPVTYKRFEHNDHQVAEIRGLWRVEGDIMGGPFVSFAHIDPENNRVVVTEGYVYAPEKPEKRNLVWQLESVLYSFRFPDDDPKEDQKGREEQ
ncbi:DUF4837 family protein [Anaerophaga thermohalophila]|jgi:hypothetical protein|uniref:DUF4837 family protein n=1 Tax=Anaerophaga thermohalophila TaxID=177400 RepID=UPI0002D2A090|nr:DUF4837 family protein [Anaerophaga thermohalophila]